MAQQFVRVRPGDLIKSDLINRMMDEFESLESRVKKLEAVSSASTGKVVITEPNLTHKLRIGDPLNIVGKNFGLPTQNVVLLEEKIIDTFESGSGDELLIVKAIPNIQNISETGREVTLTLSNAIGTATTKFILAQPAITKPTGTLQTKMTAAPVGDITANKGFTFTYTISALTTMNDFYIIEPKVDLGWKAELVDDQDNPIKPSELSIAKSDPPTVATVRTAKIRVTVPSATTGVEGNLTLSIRSKLNPDLKDTTGATVLKVGAPPPPPDQVGISLSGVFSPGAKDVNDILIPPAAIGKNVTANFTVTLDKAIEGAYKIAAPVFTPNPGNVWTADVNAGVTTPAFAAPQDSFSIKVKVPASGAVSTEMTLLVTKDSNATIKGQRAIKIKLT